MANSLLVIGRFLGVLSTVSLFIFFIGVGGKLDGYFNQSWGLVFLPIWILDTIFFAVGVRYLYTKKEDDVDDDPPPLYRPIVQGRRTGLAVMYILVVLFQILLVVQLADYDRFHPCNGITARHAKPTYMQLQCKWPSADCDDILSLKEFDSVVGCVIDDLNDEYSFAIPATAILIPVYIFLFFVFLALLIPPHVVIFPFLDVYQPVTLGGYFSPPPHFGLPTTPWEDMRVSVSTVKDYDVPEEVGAFPEHKVEPPTLNVRESRRESVRRMSDDESTPDSLRLDMQPDYEELDTLTYDNSTSMYPDEEAAIPHEQNKQTTRKIVGVNHTTVPKPVDISEDIFQ